MSPCLLAALAAMVAPGIGRAQTLAGTPIVNTAALGFELEGANQSISSNTVTIIVAERLDVSLVRDGQGTIMVPPRPIAVPLILTNIDNGAEAFTLTAAVSAGKVAMQTLAMDSDGDGSYDPAKDAPIVDGRTPVLDAGQSMMLFAIVTAEGADSNGGSNAGSTSTVLTATARAVTGSGAVGSAYSGMGDGGGDAVVGRTGAVATVTVPLSTAAAGPTLVKSQSVRAADGSRNAVRDSVITYTLEARFTDAVSDARIADAIPDGTLFVPGSLRLDDAPLTDGDDGDAGRFGGDGAGDGAGGGAGLIGSGGIAVALGDVAAASVHTVQFKARIQ